MSGWPPRWLSPQDPLAATDGPAVADFIETFCRATSDTVASRAGEHIKLRPWQRALLDGLYVRRTDGRRRHRRALIGLPRKNGKSAKGSGIALAALFAGPEGAEVYSCAGDREQARIVFGVAKRMVEADEELSSLAVPYRDAIEVPATGSVYRCLSSEARTKEGLSPTCVIFDEVHVQPNDELWDVMTLGSGARAEPLVLGITTAGVTRDRYGRDSLGYRLYKYGCDVASGAVVDPTFFFAWWEPAAGSAADHRDPAVWAEANPGYGDLVDPEDFAASLSTPENEFRTKRMNMWVSSGVAWLPHGLWPALAADRLPPPPGERVVLGFDGSHSRDSTALVGSTIGGDHLWLEGSWERPVGRDEWRVDREAVKAAIRAAARRWSVVELAHDPYLWTDVMQELADEGINVVEFPQNATRMTPACEEFRQAALDGLFSHDGSEVLARHVGNAMTHTDGHGTRIIKNHKDSVASIDSAVAAVIARSRGVWAGMNVPAKPQVISLAAVLAAADGEERP